MCFMSSEKTDLLFYESYYWICMLCKSKILCDWKIEENLSPSEWLTEYLYPPESVLLWIRPKENVNSINGKNK